MSAVYINGSAVKGGEKLLPVLRADLLKEGYKVVDDSAAADTELRDIAMLRLTVPMKSRVYSMSYEILDQRGSRFKRGSGAPDVVYLGAEPSVKVSNLTCESTFARFGKENERSQTWHNAVEIARGIRDHLKTATK